MGCVALRTAATGVITKGANYSCCFFIFILFVSLFFFAMIKDGDIRAIPPIKASFLEEVKTVFLRSAVIATVSFSRA